MTADNAAMSLPMAGKEEFVDAVDLLAEALGQRVALTAISAPGKVSDGTALIEAKWNGHTLHGGAQVKPRRLRLVAHDLTDSLPIPTAEPGTGDTVLVVRRGTAKLRQSLRERGINFVDLTGAVHVQLPWLIIDRTDLTRRRVSPLASPILVDPFGEHNSRVIRTLLHAHLQDTEPRIWGVRQLAAASGVDRTTTSKILRRLAAWDLIHLERRGRSVAAGPIEPIRLIDRWSERYDWTENVALPVHAPVGDPRRFLDRLPSIIPPTLRWALTLQAGASLLAPHAAWERIHIYVDVPDLNELRSLATAARWRPGDDGNLVLMRPVYRTTVWGEVQHIRRLPVVGFPQLLVDLWRYPLRGREQAEHLIELSHRL
ncbi:MAG: type IV toxin-antitoxin system AbiEi family antitoxin, partial [Gemmatimonadaceae bacterium]